MNDLFKRIGLENNKISFLNVILISIFLTYIAWIIPFLQSKDIYTLSIANSVILPIFITNLIIIYLLFKKILQKFKRFSNDNEFINKSLLISSFILILITIFLITNYFRLTKIPLSDKLLIESEIFVFKNKFFIISGIIISTILFVLINSYKLTKSNKIIFRKSLINSVLTILIILSIMTISTILSLLVGILLIAFTQGIQIG